MSKHDSNTEETTAVDTAPVVALVESARSAWVESLEGTRRTVESLAVATYAAKPYIGGDVALWADVDAYASQFPSLTGEGHISKSYVTLMARCGKAHSLGITPADDPKNWGRLVQKANSDERIRKAIDDPKATAPKIRKAVTSAYPKGVYTKPVKADDDTDGNGGEGASNGNQSESGDNVTLPVSMSGVLDTLETAALRISTEPITPAEHKRLAAIVETLSGVTSTPAAEVEAHRKSA